MGGDVRLTSWIRYGLVRPLEKAMKAKFGMWLFRLPDPIWERLPNFLKTLSINESKWIWEWN